MKKKSIFFLLFVLLLALMTGCGQEKKTEGEVIYYLNMEKTKILPMEYEITAEKAEEQIEEYLKELQSQPDSADLLQTIPKEVEVQNYAFRGYLLTVDFSESYYNMSTTQEVLVRAAVVRTLLQVPGVSYVAFTVNDQALVNVVGQLVGSMNGDSFVENPGQQINSSQETELTLYFSNSDGTKLEREERTVHHSSNISLEKLVIEQLIEGPKESGLKATLPTETKLITISVVEGVCYVNLDESIMNQNSEIKEEIVLYSIVDSLTELPSISKVQISVNGNINGKLRFVYDLSSMYEADYSFLEGENEEGTEIDLGEE